MTRWLFYSASYQPHGGPHYAGGDHAFVCMARTFGALGHRVHVLHQTTKDAVFAAAAQVGAGGHARHTHMYTRTIHPTTHAHATTHIHVRTCIPPHPPPHTRTH